MLPFLLPILILTTLLRLSSALECFHARTALPIYYHCQDLTNAIRYLSRQPGEDDLKAWGRRLPTTQLTQQLPKLYYIVGAVLRNTCAVKIDVDRDDFYAVDDFRQSDVAVSAGRVADGCLRAQRKIGLDHPSQRGHVYVMVTRVDATAGVDFVAGAGEGRNVSLPGKGGVLRIVSGDGGLYGGVFGTNSSGSWIDDQ